MGTVAGKNGSFFFTKITRRGKESAISAGEQPDIHRQQTFIPVKRITYAQRIVMLDGEKNEGSRWNYVSMTGFQAGRVCWLLLGRGCAR